MAGGQNRRRIKRWIGQLLGSSNPQSNRDEVPKKADSKLKQNTINHNIEQPRTAKTTSQTPPPPQSSSTPKEAVKATVKATAIPEDKVAKHWIKAKKGVLKKAKELGENVSLADLHNHSEKRFFIGHQRFSQLMEELVDEKLIDYNWDVQEANITQKGVEFINQ